MSQERKVGKDRGNGWPFAMADLPSAMRVQIDVLLREQSDFLDRTQKLMAAWTKRRHEGMVASARTFEKFCGCTDIGGVAAAYGEWLADSMDRIMADMTDTREEALRLAEIGQKTLAAQSPGGDDRTKSPDKTVNPAPGSPSRR